MRINHILFRTSDLRAMVAFLVDVIGLSEGYRPPFQFPGAWLYSGDSALFHLAETTTGENTTGNIDHVAIEGADYELLIDRLRAHQFPYRETVVPDSLLRQVFISGPDGLMLEMQFDPAPTSAE